MKKLTFQQKFRRHRIQRIQRIDVIWNTKAACYVARVLFTPEKASDCAENEIIGMRLYAETERAMEKALQDACTLYHCDTDMEVVIPDQGK